MHNSYRLANIFGLDIDNLQHTIAIEDAKNTVLNIEDFIKYCREQKDGISYMSKTEKLDLLANRFKKMKDDELLEEVKTKAGMFTRGILNKICESKTFLKNGSVNKIDEVCANGERFFTDKEANALSEVGSVAYVVELFEIHQLGIALENLYLNKYKKRLTNHQPQLNGGVPNKINKLANMVRA